MLENFMTGCFTSVDLEITEWNTKKIRFYKLHGYGRTTDHDKRLIRQEMFDKFGAFPVNNKAENPRVFMAPH